MVCMYVCGCVSVCMCVCMYVYMYICMYACNYCLYCYPLLLVCLQDPKPKEIISLLDLNITLNGVSGRPNVMQLTALIRGRTRNYFVYSDNSQVRAQ